MQNVCFSMKLEKKLQYACAILLIVTAIMMVAYQVFKMADVSTGLLFYIGQAFLLAGSIFGLDYYIERLTRKGGAKVGLN